MKSKNFDVYGNPRTEKLSVNSLRTSSPLTTPNAKFILAESATDRRLRTISQSNRVHIKAPTVQEMRREGTHSVLYRALMKKQSYKEMIETQNRAWLGESWRAHPRLMHRYFRHLIPLCRCLAYLNPPINLIKLIFLNPTHQQ